MRSQTTIASLAVVSISMTDDIDSAVATFIGTAGVLDSYQY